jgi:hypothetical protein
LLLRSIHQKFLRPSQIIHHFALTSKLANIKEIHTMTSFIPFENTLEIFVASYLASVFAIMATSQFCLAVIETLEESVK